MVPLHPDINLISQNQVAVVSSAIFRAVDATVNNDPNNHNTYLGKNGVAWVLRFGGLCALVRLSLSVHSLVD